MEKNYRKALLACYLAFITQAICANFAPLLFLKFHSDYIISLGQIALIPTAFFLTKRKHFPEPNSPKSTTPMPGPNTSGMSEGREATSTIDVEQSRVS